MTDNEMSDDETDGTITDIATWLETLEGQQVPDAQGNKTPYCDSCVQPIQPGARCQLAYSDTSFHEVPPKNFGTLLTMAMYCPECSRPTFALPCRGANEILVEATLDEDGKLWDFEAVSGSSATSGIEWNPREVLERVLGLPVDVWYMMTRSPLAASDVADLLYASGVDPRRVVNQDGSITDDEEVLQEAREKYHEKMRESVEEGRAQKVFEKGQRQDEWMLEQVGKDEWDGEDIYFDANEGEWVARDHSEDDNE